ncbi:hypothetical protein B296_00003100 [Ensete ventricosum]|uniref:Uncharacterized protein n=1 Tax=Ensete ventricosum TaxID=4639 RepID=A0A427ANE1_ENSVE|nr:hypothetical protein B296_00003100 [Ensete ventricosum]
MRSCRLGLGDVELSLEDKVGLKRAVGIRVVGSRSCFLELELELLEVGVLLGGPNNWYQSSDPRRSYCDFMVAPFVIIVTAAIIVNVVVATIIVILATLL